MSDHNPSREMLEYCKGHRSIWLVSKLAVTYYLSLFTREFSATTAMKEARGKNETGCTSLSL